MKYTSVFPFALLFLFSSVTSRSMDQPWSARQRGLAGVRCVLVADPACIVVQPAGLASMNSLSIAASLTPAIFDLPELRTRSLSAGIPVSFGGVGLGVHMFGFELYREASVTIGSGIAMDDRLLKAGASVEFRRYEIVGYGMETLVLLNVGVIHEFHEMIAISGTVDNVFNAALGRNKERLPRAVSLGLLAVLSSEFLSAVEIEKNTRDPAFIKVALEFRPLSSVALRSGVSTDPFLWSAGCSFSVGPVSFDYGGTQHDILGWTHQIDIRFRGSL